MSNTRGTSFVLVLSNNRLEEMCSTLTKGTFSSRLLLSNQVKGCSPSVAHSLPLPLGPALLNLSIDMHQEADAVYSSFAFLKKFEIIWCKKLISW